MHYKRSAAFGTVSFRLLVDNQFVRIAARQLLARFANHRVTRQISTGHKAANQNRFPVIFGIKSATPVKHLGGKIGQVRKGVARLHTTV